MENPLVGVVGLGCAGLVGKFIFLYLKGGSRAGTRQVTASGVLPLDAA